MKNVKNLKIALISLFIMGTGSCKKAEKIQEDAPKSLIVSTYVGNGAAGTLDGMGTNAQLYHPKGIAIDPSGNLYVTEFRNHRIRKITPDGLVTTLAGSIAGYADGNGTTAKFYFPFGITIDKAGNLYVSDNGNDRIRKITPEGTVSTYAGNGDFGFTDGQSASASFAGPEYITIDASNNLYVADRFNNRIRKITPSGSVSTYAGNGNDGTIDGPIATATIGEPSGLAFDASGNLYVSQAGPSGIIRKISTNGIVSRIAGAVSANQGYSDGLSGIAKFADIGNLRMDAQGDLYIADLGNHLIRKYSPKTNLVTTFAGLFNLVGSARQRTASFANGPAAEALFAQPYDLIFNPKGDILIADLTNNMIRKISLTEQSVFSQAEVDQKNWNKPNTWK